MNFSLIICTFMRPTPLLALLESVKAQTRYPDEILIIDGSTNNETKKMLSQNLFGNLYYHQVPAKYRGLTKQRNFGINQVSAISSIVCFLDDDTVLSNKYFQKVIEAFNRNSNAIGIGGVAINENKWEKNETQTKSNRKYFVLDDYFVKESSRNYLRNILGLGSNKLSGIMPDFSHGKTFSYPLNNKDYAVDLIVGMSMSFKKSVFDSIRFSTYFEGYGLYEDADFSLRALKFGQNFIATSVQLSHFHNYSGRPNQYHYGKMVVRNGWYVWRVKYPKPSLNATFKWHSITLILTLIRFINIFTTHKRKESAEEAFGRSVGWLSLLFNKPR